MNKHLHIAIPALDELDDLPILFKHIQQQNYSNFTVYICVNQPDSYWNDELLKPICQRNQESIALIRRWQLENNFPIHVLDNSSLGLGWKGKKIGVGWARKTLFDFIDTQAKPEDLVISLDADTTFSKNYFPSINSYFLNNPSTNCLSVNYYHPLCDDESANRAMLRYEMYMRYYAINLLQIRSPYAFTALGSAIAFSAKSIRDIGGFSPKKSGEDFYFLQKMVKYRGIGIQSEEKVYPAARFSNRVFFGTGPAMIKGNAGDWDSYPFYPMALFDAIKEFYARIPKLFEANISTPIDSFLGTQAEREITWNKLRKNNKDLAHFSKAIHDYFDGLRILQFLKQNYEPSQEENNLLELIQNPMVQEIEKAYWEKIDFNNSNIDELNAIRDYLCRIEQELQHQIKNISWRISL